MKPLITWANVMPRLNVLEASVVTVFIARISPHKSRT